MLATIGALFLVITLTPIVRLTVQATEPAWYNGRGGEVLVVLGGSMLVSGTGPQATLGYDTYLRCVYAAWILRSQKFHYIVVSGGDGLAEGMERLLTQNGVDPHSILTERSAESTFENAAFTRRILISKYQRTALPDVVVLTSDYHAWRARQAFNHSGFQAQALPIPDVIKRCSSPTFRLTGAVTVLSEWAKDIFYVALGRA